MGYNNTATTLTLTAKLTPIGRQKLVSNDNSVIKTFSLGDSDANYNVNLLLGTGQVPSESGDIGFGNTTSNSTANNIRLSSFVIVNSSGSISKPVSSQSINLVTEGAANGSTIISGSNLTMNVVNRVNALTDPLVNLYKTFGLSLDSNEDTIISGTTFENGGLSDTAFSGISVSKVLIVAIDNSQYGEAIDGKTVKLEIPTSAGTFSMYSTFMSNQTQDTILDSQIRDAASALTPFGSNVAAMFCDTIKKPGNNAALSWATGYGLSKPFSINGKQKFNLQNNTNISLTADTAVGVAYLDKGFVVITNPNIVNSFVASAATGTTITIDSVSTNVSQIITCIADRGEFGASTNTTFTEGDVSRISEVGLYDDFGNLMAYGKTDRHISKNINEFLALSITITI